MGCSKCGRVSHISMDYPQGTSPLCSHCNQVSHKKVDCPMLRGGAVSAPAPVTLMINDGSANRAGSKQTGAENCGVR